MQVTPGKVAKCHIFVDMETLPVVLFYAVLLSEYIFFVGSNFIYSSSCSVDFAVVAIRVRYCAGGNQHESHTKTHLRSSVAEIALCHQ